MRLKHEKLNHDTHKYFFYHFYILKWLIRNPDSNELNKEAYCNLCNTSLRAHKNGLKKHAETGIHQANASKFKRQKKLASVGVKVVGNETKSAELKIAAYVATHSAVRIIDHLGELLVHLGKKSSLENHRMHRIKCPKLIEKVIAPVMLKELITDVGDTSYSLILDESTKTHGGLYSFF